MKFPSIASLLVLILWCSILSAQSNTGADGKTSELTLTPWKLFDVDSKASLRGLHVTSESILWASGTGGTIINTGDGGKTWRVQIVPGAEKLDFRDIHAIDENTIVAMTSGTPARIYRSTDGGSNWKLCYENTDERVFLDALSFIDQRRGIVMGDPIDNSLFLLETSDAGKTWERTLNTPKTLAGEGGFAASGSNMTVFANQRIAIALGSAIPDQQPPKCRVLITENATDWKASEVPMRRSPSAGIFSICFANANDGIVVGGDYKQPDDESDNYAVTNDGGKTWMTPKIRQPPTGFRSCVDIWVDGGAVYCIAVGTNGTDVSSDLGKQWERISDEGFHAVEFTPDSAHGWACGSDGRLAKWLGVSSAGN